MGDSGMDAQRAIELHILGHCGGFEMAGRRFSSNIQGIEGMDVMDFGGAPKQRGLTLRKYMFPQRGSGASWSS